ncbi:MAG: serine/threonine protein phosphatase [halophilic archaeon J07HX64]|jgi:Serine/threonine protein phosphatase|nr:MAG: serine/threonine protein phosphatase [halophilic archaeon J07HX64]
MTLVYETGLDVGARRRAQGKINEDNVAVNLLEDGHLDRCRGAGVFVLADGAGGENAGDVASHIASVEIAQRLTQTLWDLRSFEEGRARSAELPSGETDWMLARIETVVRSTHTRLLQRIGELGLGDAYTTVVVGVTVGTRLYYAWVGDSRLYVVNSHPTRADSRAVSHLTRDHSIVERLRQQGQIDDIEAQVHPQSNRVTRALGGTADEDPAASTVQVETSHARLFGDDTLVFTSDGLVDAYTDAPALHERYQNADDPAAVEAEILERSVTDDEIRDIVLETGSLSTATDRLVDLANRRGGADNLSLILCRNSGLDRSPATGFPDRTYRTDADPLGNDPTIVRDTDSL